MKVVATTQDTHQWAVGFREELDQGHVAIVIAYCAIVNILLILVLIKGVASIGKRVNAHAAREHDDYHDEDHAERVYLVVDACVPWRHHGEHNHEDDDAGVAVAELSEVDIVRNLLLRAASKFNKEQDDRVEILGQKLREKDNRHGEVNNEADHSNDISWLAKLLMQRVCVVNIVARCFHDQETCVEGENEGDKSQNDTEQKT